MVSGYDRYFQIVRCLRDEDLRADRQPEFTQIDAEMAFVTEDDVFNVGEEMIAMLWREVGGIELTTPFPRLTFAESMERYGTDKPDLRFGLRVHRPDRSTRRRGFPRLPGSEGQWRARSRRRRSGRWCTVAQGTGSTRGRRQNGRGGGRALGPADGRGFERYLCKALDAGLTERFIAATSLAKAICSSAWLGIFGWPRDTRPSSRITPTPSGRAAAPPGRPARLAAAGPRLGLDHGIPDVRLEPRDRPGCCSASPIHNAASRRY